ncbi:uncharacterized protein UV8b_06107 [Ustilaginoidea virens]|uniref:Uncharacterized protein n=1 Tax=Ustilaginoidea virens TaxID=1159556 RepID=A0A8E5HUN3_USTVR|nr:uncharacterized protein UV8b_06107 [Ustilaginoidea virens]QUC21866.1 hypothetical protein UV8b_06107 [Ustilaginoidea virens]
MICSKRFRAIREAVNRKLPEADTRHHFIYNDNLLWIICSRLHGRSEPQPLPLPLRSQDGLKAVVACTPSAMTPPTRDASHLTFGFWLAVKVVLYLILRDAYWRPGVGVDAQRRPLNDKHGRLPVKSWMYRQAARDPSMNPATPPPGERRQWAIDILCILTLAADDLSNVPFLDRQAVFANYWITVGLMNECIDNAARFIVCASPAPSSTSWVRARQQQHKPPPTSNLPIRSWPCCPAAAAVERGRRRSFAMPAEPVLGVVKSRSISSSHAPPDHPAPKHRAKPFPPT